MSNKAPNPWHRRKEKANQNPEADLYTIQIDRSFGRAAEVKLSVYKNIDGLIVDDFFNTAIDEDFTSEPLTRTELRQLATKLLTLLRSENKKYVYANVNSALRRLLENKFGAEWVISEKTTPLTDALGVEQYIKLSPSTLELIATAK